MSLHEVEKRLIFLSLRKRVITDIDDDLLKEALNAQDYNVHKSLAYAQEKHLKRVADVIKKAMKRDNPDLSEEVIEACCNAAEDVADAAFKVDVYRTQKAKEEKEAAAKKEEEGKMERQTTEVCLE